MAATVDQSTIPLENITNATQQQQNRDAPCPSGNNGLDCGAPCYGPSIQTQYQQFVDLNANGYTQPMEMPQLPMNGPTPHPMSSNPYASMDPMQLQFYQAMAAQFQGMNPYAMGGNLSMPPQHPGYGQHKHNPMSGQYWPNPHPGMMPPEMAMLAAMHMQHNATSKHDVDAGLQQHGANGQTCNCIYCKNLNTAGGINPAMLLQNTPQRGTEGPDSLCAMANPYLTMTPEDQYAPIGHGPSPMSGEMNMFRQPMVDETRTPPRKQPARGEWRRNNSEMRNSNRKPQQQQPYTPMNEQRMMRNNASSHNNSAQKSSSYTKAKATTIAPGQSTYRTTLQGHHGRKFIVLSHVPLAPGEFVIFEGDRGDDLGEVVGIETYRPTSNNNTNGGHSSGKDAPVTTMLPMVIRPATNEEIFYWQNNLAEEAAASIGICNETVQHMGLPLVVECASFQFDRKKLTYFYKSSERVDFRRLLAEMYNKFRCRIWMERTSILTDEVSSE